MADEVVLLDFWPSSYSMRVRLALAEKGVDYESKEENLLHKSPLLLQSNPINKKIPVLIHNGKSISESLIVVEYIDDVWNHTSPLLPGNPYERAKARFWADFVDKKIYKAGSSVWKSKGKAQEEIKEELIGYLKLIEAELAEKPYFGGESLGFVDITLLPLTSWFYTIETFADFSIEKECPKLIEWVKRCGERDSVSKSIPDPLKIYEFACSWKKRTGI